MSKIVKNIAELEQKIATKKADVQIPAKFKKPLAQAQEHLKVGPDAVVEMWNDDHPHFGGTDPHRYDDGENFCAYCYCPKDWKKIPLQRESHHYADDAYGLLSEGMYNLKKARDYIKKMEDPKAEKMYEAMMKSLLEIYNYVAVQISVSASGLPPKRYPLYEKRR